MFGWFWLALLASALWGLTYVASQYMLKTLNPLQILWLSSLVVFITLGIILLVTGHGKSLMVKIAHPRLIVTIIIYALLYLLASILILKSIQSGNASLAALVESAYPIFTMIFAYIFLKETQFNWGTLLGSGFILTGLTIIQYFSSSIAK